MFSKNYLPLARINIKRAIVLLVTGQAETLEFSSEHKDAHEGKFLAVMSVYPDRKTASHRIERFIYKLWQMSEAHISSPA